MEQSARPIREQAFSGLHANSGDEVKLLPGELAVLDNYYPQAGRLLPRGGFGTRLEQTFDDAINGIAQFQELDGTNHVLAFEGGTMWELDESNLTWSTVAGSPTIDSSSELAWVSHRGKLIVTDGTNTPWMWDGTTFTTLSDAPISNYVTIYYDKVVFSNLPDNRVAFQWSEEGDPETGYLGSGFENEWEFVQRDAGKVQFALGLNENLMIGKEDSLASVRGAVSTQFQTDANREGVSETRGTVAPLSVVVVEGDVYLWSEDGPIKVPGGAAPPQLISRNEAGSNRLLDIVDDVDQSERTGIIGTYVPGKDHVLWLVPTDTDGTVIVGYAVEEDGWFKYKAAGDFTSMSYIQFVEFADGTEYLFVGTEAGDVYRMEDDTLNDGGTAIPRTIEVSKQHTANGRLVVSRLTEIQLTIRPITTDGDNEFTVTITPIADGVDGTSTAQTEDMTGDSRDNRLVRRGTNAVGRTIAFRVEHEDSDESIELVDYTMLATIVSSL